MVTEADMYALEQKVQKLEEKIEKMAGVGDIVVLSKQHVCGDTYEAHKYLVEAITKKNDEKKAHWIRWYEVKVTDYGTEHIPHCKCSRCGTEYDSHTSQFIEFCSKCGADLSNT